MNVADFELIAELLKERSGLALNEGKAYLLESRLNPVARKWNFSGIEELAQAIRNDNDEAFLIDVTEAMMTNESFFFRDRKPFDQFSSIVLPHLLEARAATRSFRIWSAACSSGQEPYTLAMLLKGGPARAAHISSGQEFRSDRRPLADRRQLAQDGQVPAVQLTGKYWIARQVRRRILPQRAE
jgi:chemotaxis protein methyltransferase CheR